MPAKPKVSAQQSAFPSGGLSLPKLELSPDQWVTMGASIMMFVDINLGNRSDYDAALDRWNAMYEMRTIRRNSPWPDAADIVVPVVPIAVDELVSRITGTAIQPRPITIRGNDSMSSQYAHIVEQFHNDEFDRNGDRDACETTIHLAARDGLAWAYVAWDLSTHTEIREEQITDPLTGQTRVDRKLYDIVDFDAPRVLTAEARDVLVVPNFAINPDKADAVARKVYMSEFDCIKMVNDGIFDAEQTEEILQYVSTGQGELSWDRQRSTTYTMSGRINVVDTAVAPPNGIGMMRGPVEMWQYHSSQFVFEGDDEPIEIVAWVHDRSRKMAGIIPFPYWGTRKHRRPFFPLSLMKRPNRIGGFGVPERTEGIQEESNALENGRLDYQDMLIQPMRYKTHGVRFRDEDRRWGPDAEVDVEKPTDFGFVPLPDQPPSNLAEQQYLMGLADRVIGAPQASAMMLPSGARRSGKEAATNAAIQGMQANKVVATVRQWLLEIIEYKHSLYMQYGPDQLSAISQTGRDQHIQLPKEVLALSFTIGIAGMGGPLDKESRRQDMLMLYQLGTTSPLIQSNLQRQWNLLRLVFETFDIPEVTQFIGTMEEAMQQQEQQAQQAADDKKNEMMLQILAHTGFKPKTGGSSSQSQGGAQKPALPAGGQPKALSA